MIELPDDELDKLFRKSSEEFDPTYEPEDWSALKKRLDREDGRGPAGWLRKWWPVGILMLLIPAGLTGYYLLDDAGPEVKKGKQISVQEKVSADVPVLSKAGNAESVEGLKKDAPVLNSDESAENALPESKEKKNLTTDKARFRSGNQLRNRISKSGVNKKSRKEIAELHSEESEDLGADKITDSKILPRSRSKAGGVFLEPDRSKGKEGDGAFSSEKNTSSKPESAASKWKDGGKELSETRRKVGVAGVISERQTNKKASGSEIVLNKNTEIDNAEKTFANADLPTVNSGKSDVEETRALPSVNLLTHLPFNPKTFSTLPIVEIMESPEPRKQEKAWDLSPKFAIRVGYSPDLSSVGLNNFSKPGSSFSLMAEYGLSPRLYVQTGVVRSEKVYYANANEYEWPPEWKKGPKASSTDATCKIIEIPLNLRYDLVQKDRVRIFAGAGTSSYYMQKENYVYNYPPNTKYIMWYDHEDKTGWFWLSHINASAGFERRITNKLSILAEPYVKIPVKKVGYGKVNLFTAGMWISLRYTPAFFK